MNDHPEKERIVRHLLNLAADSQEFTQEELYYFEQELKSLSLPELLNHMKGWHDDLYERKPVPVEEWLLSKDYMNLKGQLYDVLIDDLIELFEGGYTEAVLDGAIGFGKSYFTAAALLRMVYEVSCLKDPQLAYGIAQGTPISFVNAAIKLTTAKEVIFKYCKNFVSRSPYFIEEFPPLKDLEQELVFPKEVRLWAATSSESGVIGQNLFGGALDEINFFRKIKNSVRAGGAGEVYDHAKVLWSNAIRRMQSRFERQGKMPGLLILCSSNLYPDDFTIWRKKLAEEKGERIFTRRYSQWETKPPSFYPKERFQVSLGSVTVRPRIIKKPSEDGYDPDLDDVEVLKKQNIQIIDVPINFQAAFEQDIDMAIREIAGFPTQTAHPFFKDVQPIRDAVTRGTERGLKHPFTKYTTSLQDGATWILPLINNEKKSLHHFAHVDLALYNDAAGISVVRLDGLVEKPTFSTELGEASYVVKHGSTEWVPKLSLVLSLRIVGTKERQIPIAKVRHLLIDMINMGYYFGKITYDQWNSADSIQQLKNIGIDTGVLSVDKKLTPYETLRNVFQDGLLDMYSFTYLEEELASLEIDSIKNKVDHGPKKTKDVSDSLCGAVFNAVTFAKNNPSLVALGLVEEDIPLGISFGGDFNFEDDENIVEWLLS